MVRKFITPFFALILFFFSVSTIKAATYYVATNGSDSYNGLYAAFQSSTNGPWATIQKAANTLVAGDIVYIRGGIYPGRVLIIHSGNPTAGYITYTNYQDEKPVIDGTGIAITPSAGLVDIRNAQYLKINGLSVSNSDDAGIYVRGSSFIFVTGNQTRNTHSSGIAFWSSDNVLADHNTIIDARYVDMPHGHEESLSIASTTNFEVSNNDISLENNTGFLGNEGIDVKESSRYGKVHHNYIHNYVNQGGAIYLDAWTAGLNSSPTLSNVDVYNNTIKDAASITVGSERGGTAENIRIYNNQVINGGATGIAISNTGIADAPNGNGLRRNIEIYNNTVYKARWNGGAGIYLLSENIDNIIIKNNLIYYNNWNGEITAVSTPILSKIKVDHNLVYGPKKCSNAYPNCIEISDINDPSAYPNIHDNRTTDPLLADLAAVNLHLLPSSPAIDMGTDLRPQGITLDFDNTIRPQGTGYDIGAFEYITTSASSSASPSTPLDKPGDTNVDGRVDGVDYNVWLNHYKLGVSQSGGNTIADFNNDSYVDGVDYTIWLSNYGK